MASLSEREAPRWLLVSTAVVAATALLYFGGNALLGRPGEPGARLKVYPGMYDLRAEVAKARAAQQSGAAPSGR